MEIADALAGLLPDDGTAGLLVGRAHAPGAPGGPAVVAIRAGGVFDLTKTVPTIADLLVADDPVALVRGAEGPALGTVAELARNSAAPSPDRPYFLAPADLQPIKACGVTFAKSMLERLIEERAKGDPAGASALRAEITERIGDDLSRVAPGSTAADELKATLVERGLWSQYLEVGLGPDAEVFTKCAPMAAVGTGAEIGIHPGSTWNNPEPEVVLVIDARGRVVGATLGNDVNLRDVEGRSALLLGRAKDNNASCALGPFIRLLDDTFTIDTLRLAEVGLHVAGDDGFQLREISSLAEISRDVLDLAAQAFDCHQHPDGLFLFTGTMFAPVQDRDAPGEGFTHHVGDLVEIRAAELGSLCNLVTTSDRAPPWRFGVLALMRNLAERGLL